LPDLQKLRLDRVGRLGNGASERAARCRRGSTGVFRVCVWSRYRPYVRVDVRARRYSPAFRERRPVFREVRVMFISYKWLKELTDTKFSAQEVQERLTMVGLAIDAVERHEQDYVIDVEVPSNRPDCLSHVGIARELTVIERKQ